MTKAKITMSGEAETPRQTNGKRGRSNENAPQDKLLTQAIENRSETKSDDIQPPALVPFLPAPSSLPLELLQTLAERQERNEQECELVRKALLRRASGYDVTEQEEQENEENGRTVITRTRHIPADPRAAKIFLELFGE